MDSKAVNDLVKRYLHMKGLSDVVKLLDEKNIENGEGNENEQQQQISKQQQQPLSKEEMYILCEDIIIDGLQESNSLRLITAYSTFRSWACSSLDFIMPEIMLLCFPIFVYRYVYNLYTTTTSSIYLHFYS